MNRHHLCVPSCLVVLGSSVTTAVQSHLYQIFFKECPGAGHDLWCQKLLTCLVLSQLWLVFFPYCRIYHLSSSLMMFWYCSLSYRKIENQEGGDVPYSVHQTASGLHALLVLRRRVDYLLGGSSSLIVWVSSFWAMVLPLTFSILCKNRHGWTRHWQYE